MTALSPGPWELDTGYIFSAEVPPRCVGSVAGWFTNPPTEEQLANGRVIEASRAEPRPDDERGRNAMNGLRRVIAVADAALEKAGMRR